MFNFASSLRIYLCVGPTDMRKSFNGLYAIAKRELERNPMDGSLFVFANRRRDRVKLLYWDGTGFWVLAKRLEKGTFWWPGPGEAEAGELEIKREGTVHFTEWNRLEGGQLAGVALSLKFLRFY